MFLPRIDPLRDLVRTQSQTRSVILRLLFCRLLLLAHGLKTLLCTKATIRMPLLQQLICVPTIEREAFGLKVRPVLPHLDDPAILNPHTLIVVDPHASKCLDDRFHRSWYQTVPVRILNTQHHPTIMLTRKHKGPKSRSQAPDMQKPCGRRGEARSDSHRKSRLSHPRLCPIRSKRTSAGKSTTARKIRRILPGSRTSRYSHSR